MVKKISKLKSIRNVIENGPKLKDQIDDTQNEYNKGQQIGYNSMVELRKYQAELAQVQEKVNLANLTTEANILNNENIEFDLLNNKL